MAEKRCSRGVIYFFLLLNIFLLVVNIVDLYEMHTDWGNGPPMGGTELGWTYESKWNYTKAALYEMFLCVTFIAFGLFARICWLRMGAVLLQPVLFFLYFVSVAIGMNPF